MKKVMSMKSWVSGIILHSADRSEALSDLSLFLPADSAELMYELYQVMLNGGGTTKYTRTTTESVTRGYAVARPETVHRFQADDDITWIAEFRRYIENSKRASLDELTLGFWFDEETGLWEVNYTDVYDDEPKAAFTAVDRGEKAYGDLAAYAAGEDGTRFVNKVEGGVQ